MNREAIVAALHRIETATRTVSPERIALFADVLIKHHVTEAQMGDAVHMTLEHWESNSFPPIAKILKWAHPSTENAPRRDGATSFQEIEREYHGPISDLWKFGTEEIGWPNLVSERARLDMEDRIRARFGEEGVEQARAAASDRTMRAKPAQYDGNAKPWRESTRDKAAIDRAHGSA